MPPDVGVVVVAAGRGDRVGGGVPKQFMPVGGVPMLLRAVRPFLSRPDVVRVVVALPPAVVNRPPEWLQPLLGERLTVVAGGAARMDSVEAALNSLPPECHLVLVHDGARPFPDATVISRVIDQARHGAGAIPAIPLADTLKESERRTTGAFQQVARTIARDGLWRAQTPQGFPRSMLEAAYADARALEVTATDCAELVERIGGEVVIVPDVSTNMKVTTASDLRIADAIAAGEA